MSALLRGLRRQARLSEFRLLFVALAFIAIALSAVGLFGSRDEQAMQAQTGALLGADGLIASSRPIEDTYLELVREHGLSSARTVTFLSMAVVGSESRLARVKAISDEYPLRGAVVTRAIGSDEEGNASMSPEPGTAWVASAMVGESNLKANDVVSLGRSEFRVTREIVLEPEGAMGSFRIAPRIIISLEDLDDTGLVTPASRAGFSLLVAGDDASVSSFAETVEPRLASHEQWRAADLRSDEVGSTVGRVVSYLNLAVLLSVVLSVVAMAVAAQGLWRRQVVAGALMRCLGSVHARAVREQALIYLVAALPVAICGVVIGALLQSAAALLVERATGITLPPSQLTPAVNTVVISVVTVLCVMVPFLLAQKRVPVMVLLRADQRDQVHAGFIGALVVAGLVVLFAFVLAGDIRLALIALAGLLLAGALFWVLIRGVIGGVIGLVRSRSSAWYIALKNLASNTRRSAWLASAFGAAVFALVLLGAVREDLFKAWSESIPADAPNLFLVNIQSDEVEAVKQMLDQRDVPAERFYPIFRGRLVAIDGQPIAEQDFDNDSARQRINHEFNLTEDGVLPDGNRIIRGEWFGNDEQGFSVERDTADSLSLEIGTRITFDVGGTRVEAPVSNIRVVRWDSMKPNFFVLGSPGLFEDAPRMFITAAFAGDDSSALSLDVSQAFPAVTLIDMDMILDRLRSLVTQASSAVSVVFIFTLGAALLVLIGVLQGQREARRREIALLKTMGASRRRIREAIAIEFGLLGAVAGAVGGALALFSGWLLAVNVFEFTYVPAWYWVLVSTTAGALVVGVGGYLSIRTLVRVQPVRLLAG